MTDIVFRARRTLNARSADTLPRSTNSVTYLKHGGWVIKHCQTYNTQEGQDTGLQSGSKVTQTVADAPKRVLCLTWNYWNSFQSSEYPECAESGYIAYVYKLCNKPVGPNAQIQIKLSADQSSSSTLTESFLFDSCLIHRDTVMLE